MTTLEAIDARHSVRAYQDKPIDPEIRQQLDRFAEQCNQASGLHIFIRYDDPNGFDSRMAHYGHFRNVKNYIVLAGKKDDDFDYLCGYYGEKIVLFAQQLGLNTCWAALTFNKKKVRELIPDGESLCMVIALGYGETQGIPRKSKKAEDVSEAAVDQSWFKQGVAAALKAPTAVNQQKFQFGLKNGEPTVRVKGLGTYTKVDLGIVAYHFEVASGKKVQPAAADHPVKTGIIGAMDEEVATLKEALTEDHVRILAGMEFHEGKLDGMNVVVVKCSLGKVNAASCAQILISVFGVDQIINTGVAGSLDARIDIGDIVVSTDAVQHDMDGRALGCARGEIPYSKLFAFPADEEMRKRAVQAVSASAPNIHAFEGRVCSGDQFIASHEQKEDIISEFGGLCCEMEGAAIAQVSFLNGTPFVIIRAISDKADDSEEVSYMEFVKVAAERCAAITRYMIAH